MCTIERIADAAPLLADWVPDVEGTRESAFISSEMNEHGNEEVRRYA